MGHNDEFGLAIMPDMVVDVVVVAFKCFRLVGWLLTDIISTHTYTQPPVCPCYVWLPKYELVAATATMR